MSYLLNILLHSSANTGRMLTATQEKKRLRDRRYTVKKGSGLSRPQPGCHLPNSPWFGIIRLFLAKERLVSDIPAVDRKIGNIFYSVGIGSIQPEFASF
jgi:hypothetical protein